MNPYFERNHPKLETLKVDTCYLCGRVLSGKTTPDHIIPQSIFRKGSPSKPVLPVHELCNNGKSKDDEKFLRLIQLLSSSNKDAEADFIKLLKKGQAELPNRYIVGKSKQVRNYKKAVSLLDPTSWGLQFRLEGRTHYQLNIGKVNSDWLEGYLKTLCRGLFIRNIDKAKPPLPDIKRVQYQSVVVTGRGKEIYELAKKLGEITHELNFVQQWGDRVSYFGMADGSEKGIIYVQFYSASGVLARFGYLIPGDADSKPTNPEAA